jgi:hypothetical protein
MSSQESVHDSPVAETPDWAKGLWTLGGFVISVVAGLRAGISRRVRRNAAMGKPRKPGRMWASA